MDSQTGADVTPDFSLSEDWVNDFVDFTEVLDLPRILRLWAGIGAVSGLLERRVWTATDMGEVYPNTFIMLVAPPGVGKTQLLNRVKSLWRETKVLHVAPDNMTKAAMLDKLASSARYVTTNPPLEYHALQIVASEFGVFCPAHEMEFLSVLSALYDCDVSHTDERRSSPSVNISNPQICMLTGTQPDYLSQFLPEAAWGQGFMARTIMVYSGEQKRRVYFSGDTVKFDKRKYAKLGDGAQRLLKIAGLIPFDGPAAAYFQAWSDEGCPPEPTHLKLVNYCTRRGFNVLKLSTISAASRGSTVIQPGDVARAIQWLIDAESVMPEVFKAMKGNNDYALLQELQLYVAQMFLKGGGKPVIEQRLARFLSERTPSWNIPRLLEAADRAGIVVKLVQLDQNGQTLWRPGDGKLEVET